TVPATAAFNVCEGVPNAGVHALANTCPTLYEIRWPAIFGANLYKLFEKRDTDGDWTENLVETIQRDATTGEYYVRLRPVDFTRSERFYAVTARVGDKDSDYSATITLPTITIERLMRSAQERWHNAAIAWGTPPHGGYDITTDDPPFILWPDRTIGTPSAFEYPADDFYRADLEADATVIVDLLKYLARVFADSEWVQRYIYYDPSVIPGHTAPPPCEQLQANTDLPVVDLGPSIEDSIDGDNVIAKARAIGGFICLCDLLDVPCEWTDLATKVVTIYFSHACSGGDGCGESKQAALDRQDLPPWDHGYLYSNYDFGDLSCYVSTTLVDDNPILGQPPAPQVYFLSTEDDGIDGYTSVSFRARGRLNAPLLDQYFKGIPLPFLKAGPADHFGGAGADTPAFTAFGQALPMASSQLGSPPVDKFGWWSESGLQVEGGAVVKSNVLTNSEPALAASLVCLADPGLGWQITDQRVLLWRSRFWNNAEWDYFV
ncbi:MAG: hypothetical protein HY301_02735, partial [Verrucomicrobia bacterium]|nr:hypothetical protein [Verrucomicrobiota bacterium]